MSLYPTWLLVGVVVALGGIALWPAAEEWPHDRRYPIGVLVPLCVVAVTFLLLGFWRIDLLSGDDVAVAYRAARQMNVLAFGLGLLGLLEDLLGTSRAGQRFTLVRQVGTPMVAAVALNYSPFTDSGVDLVMATLLVSTSAAIGVALDETPGRTVLWIVPAGVILGIAATVRPELTGPAIVFGVGLGVALMILVGPARFAHTRLGAVGANPIGGAFGAMAVLAFNRYGEVVTFAVLVVVFALHQAVGFGRVIAAVPPLRWYDRLGRRR